MKTSIKLLTVILMSISIQAHSQQWTKAIDGKTNLNFYEIQKAFNDYYKANPDELNSDEENDGDYEKFKRWEWYWEQRVSATGEFPSNDIIWKEWKNYLNSHSNQREKNIQNTANWSFMGPSTVGGNGGIGRVNCIAFNPLNINSFWVGTPAGGLWKTINNGLTWTTNTDNLPVLGVSDIAINPIDSNNIYIATGDGDGGSLAACTGGSNYGDTKSIGILHSIDGGITWNTTGLTFSISNPTLIRRLIMNPNNTQILIAATSLGIYLTNDGGTTWTNQQSGYFKEVLFNPINPNLVYAASSSSSGTAQIFKSTDGGYTWTQVTNLSGVTRIKLAVSNAFPNEVNAVCVNLNHGLFGLYKSIDSGSTYTEYYPAPDCSYNLLSSGNYPPNTSSCAGQGGYDLAFAINPSDASQMFLGGVNTYSTIDSGTVWNLNNYGHIGNGNPGVPVVHGDKHWLAFHPLNNNYIYECSDGGVNYSTDTGTTWNDISNGLQISQMYRISPSQTTANEVICGQQDDGTKLLNTVWSDANNGDGMNCIIDFTNDSIQYSSDPNGKIHKTIDKWATSNNVIVNSNGTGVDTAGRWVTPYVMNPLNHNTLLIGKVQIYKTMDGGNTWAQLGQISDTNHLFVAIAYAPSDTQTIYACTFNEIYKTTNGGANWSLINTNSNKMNYIAVDPNNAQRVWVTNAGYIAGSKVLFSSDGGSTWSNYSGTLPNLTVNCIVYQNGSNDGLYVGTDVGVYYRDSSMTDWIYYNTGLPNVVVADLKISYLNNKIYAGTFGRGLWSSDLYSINNGIQSINKKSYVIVYPNPNNGNFTLSYQLSSAGEVFQIHDVTGRVVESFILNNTQGKQIIDATSLSNGVYYWEVISNYEILTKGKIAIVK